MTILRLKEKKKKNEDTIEINVILNKYTSSTWLPTSISSGYGRRRIPVPVGRQQVVAGTPRILSAQDLISSLNAHACRS